MTEKIELETKRVNGMCDIQGCERESGYLWRLVDVEADDKRVNITTEAREYCATHSQSHSEIKENHRYIGKFERVKE